MYSHIPIDRYVCTASDQLKKIFLCFSKMSFSSPSQETLNMLPKVQNDAGHPAIQQVMYYLLLFVSFTYTKHEQVSPFSEVFLH